MQAASEAYPEVIEIAISEIVFQPDLYPRIETSAIKVQQYADDLEMLPPIEIICRKRFRRYWVSDRQPIIERAHEIRRHDITSGLPPLRRWHDVKLIYLDPPYWKQAEGEYSNDPKDLAKMSLEQFTETLADLINAFGKKLHAGAAIALLIQPTQWNAPGRRYTDHVADMLRMVTLPLDMRVQCPYESQQCNAQMVEWAKANREWLVLSRELVIWRI